MIRRLRAGMRLGTREWIRILSLLATFVLVPWALRSSDSLLAAATFLVMVQIGTLALALGAIWLCIWFLLLLNAEDEAMAQETSVHFRIAMYCFDVAAPLIHRIDWGLFLRHLAG